VSLKQRAAESLLRFSLAELNKLQERAPFRIRQVLITGGGKLVELCGPKEDDHRALSKFVMSHLAGRYLELFLAKEVPWYAAGDEEVPK